MMSDFMTRFFAGWRSQVTVQNYFTLALVFFVLSYVFLPSSKAVNNFFYLFLALPGLFFLVKRFAPEFKANLLALVWAVFFLWLLLAVFSVKDLQYLKHLLYVVLFCSVVAFFVDYRIFRRFELDALFFAVFLAYVFFSILYYWAFDVYPVGAGVSFLPMRLSGITYASIVLVAFFALITVPLMQRGKWLLFLSGFFLVLFCVSYALQSRAGVLGAFTVLGGALLYYLFRGKHWFYKLAAVFFALAVALCTVWLFSSDPVFARLLERADSGRFELWQAYFQAYLDCRLWLGCTTEQLSGITIYNGTVAIEHPHNIFFSVLLYHGWIGFALFVLVIGLTLREAWRQKNPWGVFLLVSLLMLQFDGSRLVNQPNELWLLIFLPCMLILAEQVRGGSEKV